MGLQARKGTRICYVPGNHDEAARAYLTDEAVAFGNVEVRAHASCYVVCDLHDFHAPKAEQSKARSSISAFSDLACLEAQVVQETMHTCADGRRFLVLHGDRCPRARLGQHP